MNTPGRIKFSQLPVLSEVDDSDEVLFRDVDGEDPAQQVGRLSIATLRAAMGGGADDWSEHTATQDVDMDGHAIVGLPQLDVDDPDLDPLSAANVATVQDVASRLMGQWAGYPATQDVDLDGHKITGLGTPTDAADAATKGYVDGAAPAKIERTFAWGRSVAEVTDDGEIELAVYLTGEANPLRRVRVPRGNAGGAISLMNRSNMTEGAWVNLLEVNSSTAPGFTYELSGGPPASRESRGQLHFNNGRFFFSEHGSSSSKALSDLTHKELPSGVFSYAHGIHLAKQAYDRRADVEWWEPVWTPVANVDSVSNVECSYTRAYRAAGGSLVTLEGTVEVTPEALAADPLVFTCPLPVPQVGSAEPLGWVGDTENIPGSMCRISGGSLGVVIESASDAVRTASFRISYRAA